MKVSRFFIFGLMAGLFFLPANTTTETTDRNDERREAFSEFRNMITAERLQHHLEIIASDSLMGRGTGQRGLEMAAEYIAAAYGSIGLPPMGEHRSYFQQVELMANRINKISYALMPKGATSSSETRYLWSGQVTHENPSEFFNVFGGEQDVSGDVVFAGFGFNDPDIGLEHTRDIETEGKWVMVFRAMPEGIEDVPEHLDMLLQARMPELLFQGGAKGVLLIDHLEQEEFRNEAKAMSQLMGTPSGIRLPDRGGRMGFAVAVKSISPKMASRMLGLEDISQLEVVRSALAHDLYGFHGQELDYHLKAQVDREEYSFYSPNILGYLHGCHEELSEELIVISAHYDHMGIGMPDDSGDMIYNGADDNGSGTVTTLVLAEVLAEARNQGHCLDRSILFLHVTAEEHGLLGSRHYSDNPIFPIENTIANLNLDMFGRIDYNYQDKDEDYIYIIGAEIISSQLDSLLHVANERSVNLKLDMRYNDLDDRNQFYRRSDHWNFGRLGVPFIFFFSGVHDDYHQPSDTVDKIPFDLLEKRAQLIFETLVELANSPVRPVVDNEEFIRRTRQGRR